MYTRDICDGFDVGGKRKAGGEIDTQVLAWALSRWRCYAQVGNTREKLASHSPGIALPNQARPARHDQFVVSSRVRQRSGTGVPAADGVTPHRQSSRPGPTGFKAPGGFCPGKEALLLAG